MTDVTLPFSNAIFNLDQVNYIRGVGYPRRLLLLMVTGDTDQIKIIISSLDHDVLDFMNDLPYWPKITYDNFDRKVTFTFENPDDAMIFKLRWS